MRIREESTFAYEVNRPALRRSHALMLGALATWVPAVAHAQTVAATDVQFNDQFLMRPRGQSVDVSRFERGNPVPAGDYPVDLYVNGNWAGKSTVRFIAQEGRDSAAPCFDKPLLQRLGLNFDALSDSARAEIGKAAAGECVNLAALADSASYTFDLSDLRFDVSLPQAVVLRSPQGYVSPELWDEGVPSATLGYDFNTFHTSGQGYSNTQSYLGFTAGANLGSWHLREQGALQSSTHQGTSYQNIATYLQHDIPKLKSQLVLGDSFTDGAVFDSIGVRGVQLVTDDRMLPESLRGYAPVVRGVAMSNARVTVSQNGNRLYETTVAPGPFEINDLYATGYGGNLLVTVTEADGSQHSFTVPYASVTQLLRPGSMRYNVVGGVIRDAQIQSHNALVQGTVQYGFNNLITGYGGAIFADGYLAGQLGAAINTPVGAVSADITEAQADVPHAAKTSGQSLRIGYSKFVAQTNTNVAVAAYRYSSSGFWSLRDAMLGRDASRAGQDTNRVDRQRNQVQVTLNQSLGDNRGTLYVVGSTSDYWNRSGTNTQFQLGYNNMLRVFDTSMSYNVSVSRQRDGYSRQMSNQVFASLSVPLGKSQHAPTLSTGFMHDSNAGWSEQAMVAGSAGADNQFSYGVFGSHSEQATTGGGNAQYHSPYATFSGSASGGSGYTQLSAGIQGAVVAHPGGVTLANELGDTIAVVEAKDAKGARITNSSGVRIDGRGYAVVPYLMPYSLNTIEIDPKGIPLDVEFKSTSEQIAPRANSVVMVRFPTSSGRAAVISTRLPNGATLPFGATVSDASGATVGAIGQNSQLFVRGVADEGTLIAKWGDAADQVCQISYRLPPRAEDKGAYAHVGAVCGDTGIASNGGAKEASYARPVVSTGDAKPALSTGHATPLNDAKPTVSTGDAAPLDALKPALSTSETKPSVDLSAVISTSDDTDAVSDTIVSNVATASQTQGAERLMLMMNAVPMKTYARTSVVSLADLALEGGHH